MARQQPTQRYGLESAGIRRVAVVQPVARLVARDPQPRGIDYHDVVAHIQVLSECRLVLAAQVASHLRRQSTQRLAIGVNQSPGAGDFAGFRTIRFMSCDHAFEKYPVSVFDAGKRESNWWRVGPGVTSVCSFQGGGELLRCPTTAAHPHQSADDAAHHVHQEAIGADLEGRQWRLVEPIGGEHCTDARPHRWWAGDAAEVTPAEQVLRGVAHRMYIQRPDVWKATTLPRGGRLFAS